MSDTIGTGWREALQERVQRGAAWLDAVRPDWWHAVSPTAIDMWDTRWCITGQIFGTFVDGRPVGQAGFDLVLAAIVAADNLSRAEEWMIDMGFALWWSDDANDAEEGHLLSAAWSRVTNERWDVELERIEVVA